MNVKIEQLNKEYQKAIKRAKKYLHKEQLTQVTIRILLDSITIINEYLEKGEENERDKINKKSS